MGLFNAREMGLASTKLDNIFCDLLLMPDLA